MALRIDLVTYRDPHQALTEAYGIFLIVVLIGLAIVIVAIVSTNFASLVLQKPPAFAVKAKVVAPVTGKEVISINHLSGDTVLIANQSVPGIVFSLESPDGKKVSVFAPPNTAGDLWDRGGTVSIYFDGSRFFATDNPGIFVSNGSPTFVSIPPGIWVVYMTDQETGVVVNSLAVKV